jgi:hypothetical protein
MDRDRGTAKFAANGRIGADVLASRSRNIQVLQRFWRPRRLDGKIGNFSRGDRAQLCRYDPARPPIERD